MSTSDTYGAIVPPAHDHASIATIVLPVPARCGRERIA